MAKYLLMREKILTLGKHLNYMDSIEIFIRKNYITGYTK